MFSDFSLSIAIIIKRNKKRKLIVTKLRIGFCKHRKSFVYKNSKEV